MRSKRFNKAVAAVARKGESDGTDDQGDEGETSLAAVTDVSGEIQAFDPAVLADMLKQGGYVAAERYMALDEGKMLTGYLMGKSEAMVADPNDPAKMRPCARWHFELDSGARISHLGAAQLDRMLDDIPADGSHHCVVVRGGELPTNGGRRMGEWFVASRAKRPAVKRLVAPAAPATPAPTEAVAQ